MKTHKSSVHIGSSNRRILHVFVFVSVLFIAIALYMAWFELFGKVDVMDSVYNKRHVIEESRVIRGGIYDRRGITLAAVAFDPNAKVNTNPNVAPDRVRVYPYGPLYAHIIGYNSPMYGKTLLEDQYNDALSAQNQYALEAKARALLGGQMPRGLGLSLTLDHDLQMLCQKLLGDRQGAIVALEPITGKILAMVSTPTFDPNEGALDQTFDTLRQQENSPLLPRATQGLYAPGSTFKLITAAAAIENGLEAFTYQDKSGEIVIDGQTIANAHGKAYGATDLSEALAVSSNVYFSALAGELGGDLLATYAQKAGFNQDYNLGIPVAPSQYQVEPTATALAATAIGQGKLLVTPLHMALYTSAIANGGMAMKPYLVQGLVDHNNLTKDPTAPQSLGVMLQPKTAQTLTTYMVEAVKSGTAKKAGLKNHQVAGKTGTAQNELQDQDHAWFVGFAPAEQPQIALAIVLEYAGESGGDAAAPIASKIFNYWLNQ